MEYSEKITKSGLLKIARIIAERDNIPLDDAVDLVRETREEIYYNVDEADSILMDNLSLEPDYLSYIFS